MTSLRVSGTHQPLSSSSRPSSPVEEGDLGKPTAWEEGDTSTLVSSKWKGKGKAHLVNDDEDEDEDDDTETIVDETVRHVPVSYPPLDEEEIESRRIEENLKRMAAMERDRRKKARESRSSIPSNEPSLFSRTFSVSEVGRRASELLSGRDKDRPDGTNHQILESIDESLETARSPAPPDGVLNGAPDVVVKSSQTSIPTNPFEDPRYTVSENPESIPIDTLQPKASTSPSSRRRNQSPPRPLGLPVPASPQPFEQPGTLQQETSIRHRWWTDWLCGCREEDDEQAGHTNPME